ncbi:hypothetical protein SFMTTN_2072 [Sulfuriferula multivorans]|uniref:Uncharacterized protein n=2 Tax=Sulfuriferula multivorans TaxID=1559896 RepID=A0A401JF49_9PROT|nr:hypothetical protein SFMTTN_2072 [Sulfuriferula multivorans]
MAEHDPGRYVFTRRICVRIRGRVHACHIDDASAQGDAVTMGAACALRDLYGELGVSVEPTFDVNYSTTYCEAGDDGCDAQ